MAWLQKEDPAAAQELSGAPAASAPPEQAPAGEVPPEAEPAEEEVEEYKDTKKPTIASVAEMVRSFYNSHHMEEGLGPFPMGKQGIVTKVTKEMGDWAGELAGRLVDEFSKIHQEEDNTLASQNTNDVAFEDIMKLAGLRKIG